jgi:hypothetical protein
MVPNNARLCLIAVHLAGFITLLLDCPARAEQPLDLIHQPYQLDTGLVSRSISFENPTGEPGEGGKAISPLGVGRKGLPSKDIEAGRTVQLRDIEGPGTIRHIWLTTQHHPTALRGLVLRAWRQGLSCHLRNRQRGLRRFVVGRSADAVFV